MVGRAGIVAALLALALPLADARAHPIHMTMTEVRQTGRGNIELTVKVFTDDFSTAAARHSRSHLDSGKVIDRGRGFTYLLSRVRLGNASAAFALTPCGVTVTAETLLFCLRATVTGDTKSLRVSNTLMTELFGDQVNVVQSVQGKRRSSRIFVRGDGWKTIN